MNWLVTGGCGFIGVNLIERLLQDADNHIRVLDNLSVGTRDDLGAVARFEELNLSPSKSQGWAGGDSDASRIELVVGDILDEDITMIAAAGAEIIVHLAANTGVGPSVENPRLDCVTNVIGTLNMLEAARHNGVKRFVFASSGAPVGEVEPPIHEELAPHPVSPYGASKLAGEGYCSAYYRTFSVETVVLRFGNVYGPRSSHKGSVVAKFIRTAMNNEPLEIYGDGTQTRDFIFIGDLTAAISSAATTPEIGGETFQVATNSEVSIGELVKILAPVAAHYNLGALQTRHTAPRVGDVKRNFSDTSKARSRLGWRAETQLVDGLKTTVKWFLDK